MQFAWYFRYAGPDGKFGLDQSEAHGSFFGQRSSHRSGYQRPGGQR